MNVQLEKPDKRTAILKSTLELIKEHGFHGTPMSEIARNARVAAGTIYHYFDSKDTLITALYVYVKEELARAMLAGYNENVSYKDRFLAFWVNQCKYYISNEGSLVFMEQYVNSPYPRLYPDQESDLFRGQIVPFFRSGIENGTLKPIDSELLGPVIRGAIVATAKYHLAGRYLFTEKDLYDIACISWDGIKKHQHTNQDHDQ
ncbi:TetR/AcrR family transcriptional regulator [Hufsiella ginkgonis]|uniref:TetR family transcriptional regulator n=1 Tax=Hufsiella ginkgonis TaxID=2695274 RepID=A0A7K1Y173_9SPHI|nr:TetR/AcrR family transcriptional regulator [Hufsiella ginkgonis]MXV16426.1 TetR family transcriptional regulator [Hufsiella ginkgonis]